MTFVAFLVTCPVLKMREENTLCIPFNNDKSCFFLLFGNNFIECKVLRHLTMYFDLSNLISMARKQSAQAGLSRKIEKIVVPIGD